MITHLKHIALALLLLVNFVSKAQTPADTTERIFQLNDFLFLVKTYHPASKQAALKEREAKNIVRSARGNFDPNVAVDLDQKYYKGKKYYSLGDAALKVPTWYGVEFKAGFEQNEGVFLNPEHNVPVDGLWYGGLSVSALKGLVIDKRRAELKKGFAYARAARNEQQIILNNLYFDAIQQYWSWAAAYNNLKVYEGFLENAEFRFEGVKQSFKFGDYPAIDTLESFIQVQTRRIDLNDARIKYQKQSLLLSNYLWNSNEMPLEVTESTVPMKLADYDLPILMPLDSLDKVIADLGENHPELLKIQNKIDALNVDRRLKFEYLKPTLDLNWNILSENVNDNIPREYNVEDYKWGVSFKTPLFLRKERGDWQLAKIKVETTELKAQQKSLEIKNKVNAYYTQQELMADQVIQLSSAVKNMERLLEAERQKFRAGESSLFIINKREVKLIKMYIDLNKLIAYYNINDAGLSWAMGNLNY